ncbi:unnamed protein product [Schistocephalus solidus]|uniref:Ypt/rab gtpase activating protein n=1 Tax=Schistocephalus solidus TaxID=70667 RepID=A0A183SYH2_SCHSO|nr:unnamed protein product [Schistocephalus solidus]
MNVDKADESTQQTQVSAASLTPKSEVTFHPQSSLIARRFHVANENAVKKLSTDMEKINLERRKSCRKVEMEQEALCQQFFDIAGNTTAEMEEGEDEEAATESPSEFYRKLPDRLDIRKISAQISRSKTTDMAYILSKTPTRQSVSDKGDLGSISSASNRSLETAGSPGGSHPQLCTKSPSISSLQPDEEKMRFRFSQSDLAQSASTERIRRAVSLKCRRRPTTSALHPLPDAPLLSSSFSPKLSMHSAASTASGGGNGGTKSTANNMRLFRRLSYNKTPQSREQRSFSTVQSRSSVSSLLETSASEAGLLSPPAQDLPEWQMVLAQKRRERLAQLQAYREHGCWNTGSQTVAALLSGCPFSPVPAGSSVLSHASELPTDQEAAEVVVEEEDKLE